MDMEIVAAAASVAAGIAVIALAILALIGNALFDFALNPRARHGMPALIHAGASEGIDASAFAETGPKREARAWFEAERTSVTVRVRDRALAGWLVPAHGVRAVDGGSAIESARRGGIWGILCHGYAGSPADLAVEARMAHQMGASVIAPAARGHERNSDGYIGMGWTDSTDLLSWIDLILDADPDARIALFGISMGGAEVMMASGLDLPPNVRCIIEDCGYTSVWDEFAVQLGMQFHLPVVPLLNAAEAVCRLRAGYGFRRASAVERLGRSRVPMLFIHGTLDVFVPFGMLDEVFDACASPVKERLVIEGAGHGLASSVDPDRYYGAIGGFLERHLL